MLKKKFETFLRRNKAKTFHAWQIELTTDCPLRCRMCSREGQTAWQHQRMPIENFKKLLPYLADVEAVVLEGWGESLLHPDLTEIVRLVKRAGPRVGFVTSGFGLGRERIRELIEAGIDFMGFSLAGTTPATHDAIRVHSHLPDMLDVIRLVSEEKIRLGSDRPQLHIVYLMLRENIVEVPSLPALAAEIGIEEVILINNCHIATPWQESQRVFTCDGNAEEFENLIRQAQENARAKGIRLKRSALCMAEAAVCSENPLQNLYVSAEGEVAPCVYAHPPFPRPSGGSSAEGSIGSKNSASATSSGSLFQPSGPPEIIRISGPASCGGNKSTGNCSFPCWTARNQNPLGATSFRLPRNLAEPAIKSSGFEGIGLKTVKNKA